MTLFKSFMLPVVMVTAVVMTTLLLLIISEEDMLIVDVDMMVGIEDDGVSLAVERTTVPILSFYSTLYGVLSLESIEWKCSDEDLI